MNASCLTRSELIKWMLLPALVLATSLQGQTQEKKDGTTQNPPPVLSAADQKWAELQALFTPPTPGEQPIGTDAEARVRVKKWQAERFLKAATEANAFAKDYPDTRRASPP